MNDKRQSSSGLLASLRRLATRALVTAEEADLPPLRPEPGPSGIPPARPSVRGPGAKHRVPTGSRTDGDHTGQSGPSGLPAARLRVEKRGL